MQTPGCSTTPVQQRRVREGRGFLLLDTLLAMMMALMFILGGMSLMMTASSASDASQQTTMAYNTARQQIENIRALRGVPLADGAYTTPIGEMPQMGPGGTLAGGTIRTTIGPYDTSTTLKRVTVALRWRAGERQQSKQIELTTIVAPRGVTP